MSFFKKCNKEQSFTYIFCVFNDIGDRAVKKVIAERIDIVHE